MRKVLCKCKKCDGKLVDRRTRDKHFELEINLASSVSGFIPSPNFVSSGILKSNIGHVGHVSLKAGHDETVEQESDSSDHDNNEYISSKKRRRQDRFQEVEAVLDYGLDQISINSSSDHEGFIEPNDEDEDGEDCEDSEDSEDDGVSFIEGEEGDDDDDGNENSDNDVDSDRFLSEEDGAPNTTFNNADSWVLLWILKYQSRFRLPDVAIDALIKFFQQVLQDADYERFKEFPPSLYIVKKKLQVGKCLNYAVCPKCNTLYSVAEVIMGDGFKCKHVEFPRHPMKSKRKPCEEELTKQVPLVNGYKRCPKLLFPLPSLKMQITSLYRRPDFEEQLQKWTNRHINGEIMTDIYDGNIWKNFPSQMDNLGSRFFTKETADSNLGIMINLDWFQPFDSSMYSCGAIYGVICNLPREVRFNKENILTLGLLPGPTEVKLDKINNYLTPIIDELIDFWNGVKLLTNKCPNGKKIRLAVICCSNDIPAARKLCGHISALSGCHRCYKRATRKEEGQKPNFGGFDDMENWFTMRNVEQHRIDAEIWKEQVTEEDRKRHVSTTQVRWSEMLLLPYHNPIRHLVVDPMHNLFLGIAQWIIKKLWIEENKITNDNLKLMEKRAKAIKLPADLGRVPSKISTGEGFSGFTADQWKTFVLVYAIPIMWDLLSAPDQEILGNFVRACSLLVCRIINNAMITEAHERLLRVAMLVEENYGPEKVTPNLHLCLHIKECCEDYGPLYSFWCFSFERMNGILGKLYTDRCKQ